MPHGPDHCRGDLRLTTGLCLAEADAWRDLHGMSVLIRDSLPRHVAEIAAIYGDAVLHGNASFELDPPDAAEVGRRRAALLAAAASPYLVAEDAAGRVVGYSHAGTYRPRPGYRFTVENSVYVAPDRQGQGIGRALLPPLIARCEQAGFRPDGGGDRRLGQSRLDPLARGAAAFATPGCCRRSAGSTAAGWTRC